ncbi:unnamed protein product [Gadus morhua 'NCC']
MIQRTCGSSMNDVALILRGLFVLFVMNAVDVNIYSLFFYIRNCFFLKTKLSRVCSVGETRHKVFWRTRSSGAGWDSGPGLRESGGGPGLLQLVGTDMQAMRCLFSRRGPLCSSAIRVDESGFVSPTTPGF